MGSTYLRHKIPPVELYFIGSEKLISQIIPLHCKVLNIYFWTHFSLLLAIWKWFADHF